MPNLLALTNTELIALVRDNPKASPAEVHLAERLSEAMTEIDAILMAEKSDPARG